MAIWRKRSDEEIQYTFDFAPYTNGREGADSDWLASGETISGATVTAQSGVTVENYGLTDSNTSVTCRLSGGTAGNSYTVTCTINTSGSQTAVRSKELQVVSRYT
jgi:hypothetical protein